jgi:hypothetical protein
VTPATPEEAGRVAAVDEHERRFRAAQLTREVLGVSTATTRPLLMMTTR